MESVRDNGSLDGHKFDVDFFVVMTTIAEDGIK